VTKKDMRLLMAAMAGLGTLLPGDVIHDTAPVTDRARANPTAAEQIAAAEAKRQRKAAKRGKR
jgi:hypothetical protein